MISKKLTVLSVILIFVFMSMPILSFVELPRAEPFPPLDNNTPPTVTGEKPANGSVGICTFPIMNVTVDDAEGDFLDATWWSNFSGPWAVFAQDFNINTSIGAVSISQVNSNFTNYSTTYYWSVNVTDGSNWTNRIYHFTTRESGMGWGLLDNNTVLEMWNRFNHYYFNVSNGLQFTNHYNEYWSHNVMMIGYLTGENITDPDDWNLIYRTDELGGFTKRLRTDNQTYINVTLWKDLTYGNYDFRLAIRYHLGVDDMDLSVTPYVKNLGMPIPFTTAFGWEVRDIKIGGIEHNSSIYINQTGYLLNQTPLDEKYTNLTRVVMLWNETSQQNENVTIPDTRYTLYRGEHQQELYLKWNGTQLKNKYLVWVKNRTGQYNAPVTLFLKIGTLDAGQEKYTTMHWLDSPDSVNLLPDADGDVQEWDRSSMMPGEHWDVVDDPVGSPDEDLTYVHTDVVDEIEEFNHTTSDLLIGATITNVRVNMRMKYMSAGDPSAASMNIGVKIAGTRYPAGASARLTTSYYDYGWNWVDNPADSRPWEKSDIDSLQSSLNLTELTGLATSARCTQVYITVTYTPVNNAPTQSNQKIWNATTSTEWILNATGVSLTPTSFNVTINDLDGDKMNITILTNATGPWTVVNQTSNSGLSNGTYPYYNTSWVYKHNITFYISFNVTDGKDWTNRTFNFTTAANIPPEIGTPTVDTDPVGYGYNVTINVSVWDNDTGVSEVKCNVTYPDSTSYNFTMANTGGAFYEKEINLTDTWQLGWHNYTIWATDGIDDNTSSQYSFNVSAQCDVTVQTEKDVYGANEYVNLTDPPDESTYYFDSWDEGGEEWDSPDLMVNGEEGDFAATAEDGLVQLLLSSTYTTGGSGTILGVEIRAWGFVEGAEEGDILLRPVFTGGDGDNHTFVLPLGESGWSDWYNITTDTNAPIPWTWTDVANLDCDVESVWVDGTIFCGKVDLKVIYSPPPGENAPTQSNQKIWNATTKVEKSLNATAVNLYPTSFNVTINDLDGDKMNITILTNATGPWTVVNQTSNSGLSNGTYPYYNTSWIDSYNTTYYISFNLTDGTYWTNETYHFTTWLGYIQSKIDNVGTTNCKGYLLMQIHYNDSGSWHTVESTIDETSTRTINAGNHLKLDAIFNGTVYTSTNLTNGTGEYRVYVAFRDKFDSVLKNDDDTYMNSSYNFTYTVPAIVFDINRSSFGFGVIQNDTITYSNATGADTFRIYNNGTCSIDIDINGTNATASGVADWVLSAANGDNLYKLEIYNTTTDWFQINLTADTWYSNMAQSTNITANIRITTPTVFYSGKQMSCNVYMVASIH